MNQEVYYSSSEIHIMITWVINKYASSTLRYHGDKCYTRLYMRDSDETE